MIPSPYYGSCGLFTTCQLLSTDDADPSLTWHQKENSNPCSPSRLLTIIIPETLKQHNHKLKMTKRSISLNHIVGTTEEETGEDDFQILYVRPKRRATAPHSQSGPDFDMFVSQRLATPRESRSLDNSVDEDHHMAALEPAEITVGFSSHKKMSLRAKSFVLRTVSPPTKRKDRLRRTGSKIVMQPIL